MEIIVTRHGETDYNVKGIIQGQKQSKLTGNGLKQAEALSNALKNKKIDYIYTSFLSRSINTAEIVNKYHKSKIRKLKILNERKLGVLEGKKGIDAHRLYPHCLKDAFFRPEKGENFPDVVKRARLFIKKILKENRHETILIVGHKIINLAILAVLLKKNIKKAYSLRQDSTSINIISVKGKNIRLKKFNDTQHLKKNSIKKIKEIEGIC